jgi:mannonate dehydratase
VACCLRAQHIDPASPRCDAFCAALACLDLPRICHGGKEKAVPNPSLDYLNNPFRLRRPLEAGLRVLVPHCASQGEDEGLGHPGQRAQSFSPFLRFAADGRKSLEARPGRGGCLAIFRQFCWKIRQLMS